MAKKTREAETGREADQGIDRALSGISRDNILQSLIDYLKEQGMTEKKISEIVKKRVQQRIDVPVSVFSSEKLGPLEALVKFLKENRSMTYSQIAAMLKRDARTVWTTYNNSLKKSAEPIKESKPGISVPVSIFCQRDLSVLESLCHYLKKERMMRIKDIAAALSKDQRNIWTVCRRADSKIRKSKETEHDR